MGRAVIYARFSCSKQREASIEDQIRVCSEWCAKNGYLIVRTYSDYAMSGRTDERPQFQEMIANAGESDIVLVYMMDRFSRDIYDAPIYKKKLRDKGVKVISATETMPDGPESLLLESIYEAMAAMESAHTSRRVRRGLEGNARKCMHNGVKVFGYDWTEDGTYAINEEQAETVREVFRRRTAGETMEEIARDLASRGIKSTYGKPCRQQMIVKMLSNEKYIGTYTWGDIRIEGGMPAILTEEQFRAAQHVRGKKRRKEEHWHDFAFAGKGVCLGCGRNLVGTSGIGRNGTRYHYYQCSGKCGVGNVRADVLEEEIARRVRGMLGSREHSRSIARRISETVTDIAAEARLDAARRTYAASDRAIANIMRAVEEGMPYADVRDRLSELKAERARADADVKAWECRATIDVDGLSEFISHGAGMDDSELLDTFVWQVQMSDEMVAVVLTYDMGDEPARWEIPRGFVQDSLGGPRNTLCEPRRGVFFAYIGGRLILCYNR